VHLSQECIVIVNLGMLYLRHSMRRLCKHVLPTFCLCVATAVVILRVTPVRGNITESPPTLSLQITNVMQLRELADANQRLVASVHMEGDVWWSSDAEGRLILHDDTGTGQLELDIPCQLPRQGERLSLQGTYGG